MRTAVVNCAAGRFLSEWEARAAMRTKTAILSITNLKADDLPGLREALNAVPGVEKVDFSLERSVAVLDFDPTQSHIDDFLRAVLKAGFQVQ
jgi:heavy-metal-associated domain-containing protein